MLSNDYIVINLTKGKTCKVCKCHYDLIKDIKWQYHQNKYALGAVYIDGKHKILRMHRIINNTPVGMDTDHINIDKLDNRCCNLRTTDRTGNNINSKIRDNNTSGYKNITFDKHNQLWRVQVVRYKKVLFSKRYKNIDDAIKERDGILCQISI